MLPSIFGENLFDDFFDDDFFRMPAWTGRDPLYGKRGKNLMKTDVRETDTSYELDVDLPGFKKDEINVDLQNGYLTIQASKGLDKDQKDQQGRYIRHPEDLPAQAGETGAAQAVHHRHRRLTIFLPPIWARGQCAAGLFSPLSSSRPRNHRNRTDSCPVPVVY